MVYLLLALGAALVLWGLYRYVLSTPPAVAARTLRLLAIGLMVLAAVVLLAVGQARLAAIPGIIVLPLLFSLRRRRGRKAGPPDVAPGDDSVGDMTPEEAAEILGVGPDATRDDVIAAHARQKALRQAVKDRDWKRQKERLMRERG